MNEPFTEISIDEYQAQFGAQDNYLLVDVRETEEYSAGHLPNAINIPLSQFQFRVGEIPAGQPVVLVCARGGRSAMAADFMATQGYKALYNLVDGTAGWFERGLPLEK
jgi:rhodanese-related sulfurtransferase